MKPDFEKAPKEVREWLDKTEKATGLKKSILIISVLTDYALKASKQEENSQSKVSTGRSKKCAKRGNI